MWPRAKAEPGCARGAFALGLITHCHRSALGLIGTGGRCCWLRDGSSSPDTAQAGRGSAGWDRGGAAEFQSRDFSPSLPASRACSLPANHARHLSAFLSLALFLLQNAPSDLPGSFPPAGVSPGTGPWTSRWPHGTGRRLGCSIRLLQHPLPQQPLPVPQLGRCLSEGFVAFRRDPSAGAAPGGARVNPHINNSFCPPRWRHKSLEAAWQTGCRSLGSVPGAAKRPSGCLCCHCPGEEPGHGCGWLEKR